LWTRKAIKELIDRELGVVLAINKVGDYLRKWGLRHKNPRKRLRSNVIKKYRNGWIKNIQL